MPEKIGTVINRVLLQYGISKRIEVERLFIEWRSDSQNTIINFCTPEFIKENILHVKAKDEQWRQALKGREPELFDILNKQFHFKHIKGVIVT